MDRPSLRSYLRAVLTGYSAVAFSGSIWAGLLFLAASFYHPEIGLVGLAGNLAATAVAYLLRQPRALRDSGVFGVNGLLIGLASGYFHASSSAGIPLSLVGAVGAALLVVILSGYLTYRYDLPVLSIPFVLFTWMMLSVLTQLKVSSATPETSPFAGWETAWTAFLPSAGTWVLKLSATLMFQSSVLSGTLILLGMLVASRIGFAFGVWGALIGASLATVLGMPEGQYTQALFGLNATLTAMAVGAVFLVPTRASLIYAAIAVTVGLLVAWGFYGILNEMGLPLLIFPFWIVTVFFLYPSKVGILHVAEDRLHAVPLAIYRSPERNRLWLAELQLPRPLPVGFHLPFWGRWKVTQGVAGELTHIGPGAFAWDFSQEDAQGFKASGFGLQLSDFYAYNLPILAPADGTVVNFSDGQPDNPPGEIDRQAPWGNFVVLDHGYGLYSELSHLQPGTLAVRLGQVVRTGEILARLGNSGYSPWPHLHYQLQTGTVPGAATLRSSFSRFLRDGAEGPELVLLGEPVEDEWVEPYGPGGQPPLVPDWWPLRLGGEWHWTDGKAEETWRVDADPKGHLRIISTTRDDRSEYVVTNEAGLIDFVAPEFPVHDLGPGFGHGRSLLELLRIDRGPIPVYLRPGLHWRTRRIDDPLHPDKALCGEHRYTIRGSETLAWNSRFLRKGREVGRRDIVFQIGLGPIEINWDYGWRNRGQVRLKGTRVTYA